MHLDHASFTHPGGHIPNQDAARILEEDGCLLAIVCDGLGGMMGGEVAANFCADEIMLACAPLVQSSSSSTSDTSPATDSAAQSDTSGLVAAEAVEAVEAAGVAEAAEVVEVAGAAGESVPAGAKETTQPDTPASVSKVLAKALVDVHEKLRERQIREPNLAKARTTAALLFLHKTGVVSWASVGDSRVYVFADEAIASISDDDSAGFAAFTRGETDHEGIRLYDGRGSLTACLGDERTPIPHEGTAQLTSGDALILCSDGFWECVYNLEMQVDLYKAASANAWLRALLVRLAERSRLAGDNVTAIVCRITE